MTDSTDEVEVPDDISCRVYYVLTVKLHTPGTPLPNDRVQKCQYYRSQHGRFDLVQMNEETQRVELYTEGKTHICLQQINYTERFPIPKPGHGLVADNEVTLFAAVASTEVTPGTVFPSTFPASITSSGADPTVIIPVAQAPSKGQGLILVFKEDVLGSDGVAGLRATLDPEIKGSTG